MMSDHDKLVKQAREHGPWVAADQTRELLAALADAVEQLQSRVSRAEDEWVVALSHRDQAIARVVDLEAGIRQFAEHEDTHEPGPFVKDGNWHPGPCVEGGERMEDTHPDGFQICADEDCGLYWPCPTAELIALLDPG